MTTEATTRATAECPYHRVRSLVPALTGPARASGRPPGPRGLPILGSLRELRSDPLAFFTELHETYGDVASFRVMGVDAWLLSAPRDVEALLTDGERFTKGRALAAGRRLLGNGLLTSEGEVWRRQRRLAQPAFHRHRVDAYGGAMVRFAARRAGSWVSGETRDLHEEMMGLTLEVVAHCLFSADVAGDAREVGQALEVALRELPLLLNPVRRALAPVLPTRRYRDLRGAIDTLDGVIHRMIDERRADGRDRGDLMSTYLSARDEDGRGMDAGQLRDEVMTLFLAGHETTAIALSWAFHLLGESPAVQARLRDELARTLGDRDPVPADLPSLPYLDAVVRETLRLYPPAWSIGRLAAVDLDLAGHRLRKGTTVVVSPWVTHRDRRTFEDPLAFRPERWLDGLASRLPRLSYFPFGAGPRSCIGASFAILEAQLVLATVLRRFGVRPSPGHVVTPWPSITLRPRHGVRMVLTAR